MNAPPKQVSINLDPAMYALSNAQIAFTEEDFQFLFISGNQARQFSATPAHAKRVLLLLQQQIEAYEKAHKPITTSLPTTKGQTDKRKMGF